MVVRTSLSADVGASICNVGVVDLYEEFGRGEGVAVDCGDLCSESVFLCWGEGDGVLDFVDGHFDGCLDFSGEFWVGGIEFGEG